MKLLVHLLPIMSVAVSMQATPALISYNYARFRGAADPDTLYVCSVDATPCQGSALAPGTNWTLHYSSSSSALYGVLRSKADAFLTGDDSLGPLTGVGTFPNMATVGGRAAFRDTYTIGGGTGTGTLLFTFAVTGTSSQTPGQSGRPQFNYVPATDGWLDYSRTKSFLVSKGKATVAAPFTFGTPTDFSIEFYALAQFFRWVPGAAASADYSHTAILKKIEVKNSKSAYLSSFTINAESGTRYYSGGVVPEPATGWMLGVALAAAAGWSIKRHRAGVRRLT